MLICYRNVPIGAAVLASIFLFLHLQGSMQENRTLPLSMKLARMDAFGILLFLRAIYCLLLVLQWGGQIIEWRSFEAIGLFVGFCLLISLFGLVQWKRGEHATIPLRVLRQRSILMGALFLMLLGMSSFVVSSSLGHFFDYAYAAQYAYYLPVYFQ